jgi:hypothetical protein
MGESDGGDDFVAGAVRVELIYLRDEGRRVFDRIKGIVEFDGICGIFLSVLVKKCGALCESWACRANS